jgi:hypothetical protein
MKTEYDIDLTDRYAYATVLAVERAGGKKEGLLSAARAMKKRKIPDAEIAFDLGLVESEVSEIKVDE